MATARRYLEQQSETPGVIPSSSTFKGGGVIHPKGAAFLPDELPYQIQICPQTYSN
jgi:hypothetical protein